MNKRILAFALIFSTVTLLLAAWRFHPFTPDSSMKPDFPSRSWPQEWATVDSLENNGLHKQALDRVNLLCERAKAESNGPMHVKSVLHALKYLSYIEEMPMAKNLERLDAEMKSAGPVEKAIFHNFRAEMYWNYFQQNQWSISHRTETVNFDPGDVATWDLRKLMEATLADIVASLKEKKALQAATVGQYAEIISSQTGSAALRPTVYDLLAARAMDILANEQSSLTQPADKFEVNEDWVFAPSEQFSVHALVSTDTLNFRFHTLSILQECEALHLRTGNVPALVDVALRRLAYVKTKSVDETRDSLYLSALEKMDARHRTSPASTLILHAMAVEHTALGASFDTYNAPERKGERRKAHDLCLEAEKRFPGSHGAELAKSQRMSLEAKSLSIETEKVVGIQQPSRSLVTYNNVTKIHQRIIPVSYDAWEKMDTWNYNRVVEYLVGATPVWTGETTFPADDDLNPHRTELAWPQLKGGQYVFLISANPDFGTNANGLAYTRIAVSDLALVPRQMPAGVVEAFVTDRTSGKPLRGATVTARQQEYDYKNSRYIWKTIATLTTNDLGMCSLTAGSNVSRSVMFTATLGADHLRSDDGYYQYHNSQRPSTSISTQFFTDRAIYRPGQTIYFKGIVLETTPAAVGGTTGPVTSIKKGYATTVYFYNANSEEVAKVDVTTNEFGTFSGSFTAPQGVLNGQMRLQESHGSHYFSVEDYKRPRFEVTVDPVKEAFRLGDQVTVKGKAEAYAGSNIDGATVKYRVVRQASFPWWGCWYWWRPYPSSPQMEITSGETTTAADGTFEVKFTAIPDKSLARSSKPQFNYTVLVDVVDMTGETRSGSGSVSIGYISLNASMRLPAELDTERPQDLFVSTTNLNGQPEPAKGTITIHRLEGHGRILRDRLWQRPDKFVITQTDYLKTFPHDIYDNEDDHRAWKRGPEVWKATFDTGKEDSLRITGMEAWAPGRYVVELLTQDKYGEEVKVIQWVSVSKGSSGQMALPAPYAYTSIKTYGEPGDKASFTVGSSHKDAMVLFEVWHRRKLVSREWIKLSDQVVRRELAIEEQHRGNFGYSLMMVHDGRMYSLTENVMVPWSNKNLKMEVETFRDKLLPGAKEEWKITLKGPNGEAVAAEVLAGMYDASLDVFRANGWYLNPNHVSWMEWSWQTNDCFGQSQGNQWNNNWNAYYHVNPQLYDAFNYFGFNFYYITSRGGGGGIYYSRSASAAAAPSGSMDQEESLELDGEGNFFLPSASFDANRDDSGGEAKKKPSDKSAEFKDTDGKERNEGQSGEGGLGDVKVRTNLNETAFFFPQLKTNEKGETVLSFTMPEALTRWKFMLLGHTADLKVGSYNNTLVTQKDLMVMPNAPRFMREGDKIWFTAKVTNLTEVAMNGQAQLELMDALTGRSIDAQLGNNAATVSFNMPAGQSAPLLWQLSIPDGIQAITWRVKAKAGNFTDGEESSLPVLTNRMLVTESMPLPVRPLQTRTFTFDRMKGNTSTTLRHHKYTLEFTSNPAWYAIQALPYMMEYPYECSEQTFSRFYANSIASHVANSHPRIKTVFDSWKTTDKEALLSNLEKNQELKYLLLEETPWVMDAADERERKQRVGLLFDLNRMANEQQTALRKLEQAQVSNGAWPWFPGMPESEYITRHIVCGLGHLDKLGVRSVRDERRTWQMTQKAIGWLDWEMKKDYDWIMAHATNPEDDHLGHDRVHYMYARSFFLDQPIRKEHQEAYDYWLRQMEKYWNKRLGDHYIQGMMALALHRNQRTATSTKIMASLKDVALHSDEMGMYWKKEFMGGWSWYEAPIEQQAMLIEAFGEVSNDMESVEELKIWLLKQKQTQDWKTTRATAEACYALLLRGTDFLAESGLAQITVGGQTLDPTRMENVKVEAGTGYFKTSWAGADIKPEMAEVKVTNPNKVVSWGAVYWQYFEQLDKITSFRETGVKINKQLFLQENSPRGPVITPVTDKTALKPGDLIKVRIEIRCDRDMDYVHMKDMRASGFEPVNVISRYKWQDGLGYYESTRDAATNFFFDRLPKGTWVFEYPLRVSHRGDFSNGITTLQCMYAPEFTTHSQGIRVLVK